MYRLSATLIAAFLPAAFAGAVIDTEETAKTTGLRGSVKKNAVNELTASLLFPMTPPASSSSDPLATMDFARTGLDRSLSYINFETELNLPLSPEQISAMSEYINLYSVDGNDDATDVCPDYEGDVDPNYRSTVTTSRRGGDRKLQGTTEHDGMVISHSEHDYVESSCNANLTTTPCVDWSAYFDVVASGNDYLNTEVKIPCGACVNLDASPGDALHGSTLDLAEGLNVVGKLVIPNDAAIEVHTRYVFVQGLLAMPGPASGSSTGISSEAEGDRVVITLYGMEDITFVPDDATDNAHHGGKGVNNKAFVIAGGRVDIRAMDPTCPSWVKLQSIEYGAPLPNVALGKPATESTTYNNAGSGSLAAVDGDDETFTHTKCWTGINQWWEVDLQESYTISNMNIVNRLDCCGGRLHDYDIYFYGDDVNKTLVDEIYVAGQNGDWKAITANYVSARYVRIQLRDKDCLQLGEVKIQGYPASSLFPTESLDTLTVGEDAARCWSTKGSRILMTSDTFDWKDSHTAHVADVPSPGPGKLAMLPLPKKKTAVDQTFGYPDFAVEVALLDRSVVIRGEKESGEHKMIGGHVIVLHTPHVGQHLEGALLTNMGQQARLGRYPLHFHMSECVHGSTLAKNVIWESNQRCVVIHGTHNVTVSENVAYDTKGHCFMLEDGGEWDNKFLYNLGAKTATNIKIRDQETDDFPSTFWITNPANHWIGNVAAGSAGPGIWFELKLRAPSSGLDINRGINPKFLPLGTFDNNTAHSNGFRAGITTYRSGYRAPPGTTWNNIKVYKNQHSGIFQHGTNNIRLVGGLLADNDSAARNFHHERAVYDGVEVIGRSEHVKSLIDEGRVSVGACSKSGGISIQPNEGMGLGTTIKNSVFSGFDNGCTGGKNAAVYIENDQVRNAVFDASPTLQANTFGANDEVISACMSIKSSRDGWVRYIAIEDVDGSMSGIGPGFYVQNEDAITNFIAPSITCHAEVNCLRFCPGACLRLGIISISQDMTTRGFNMIIQDGTKSATVARGPIWFNENQNHISAHMPMVLPAPTSEIYQVSFTDKDGRPAWPGYATTSLEKEPACTGGLVDASQVELVMPPPDTRCDDLFFRDVYPSDHGWQNFFAGMDISEDNGSYVISTNRRKHDRGHVNLSRTLDASCFKGLSGRKYTIGGKIRIKDAEGLYVATDGTSDVSPKVSFVMNGVMAKSWNIATSSDGTWTDWSAIITLPQDTSLVWKASIIIDKAAKREFSIKDWGMVLVPSESPTTGPTSSPSLSPTTAEPTSSPTSAPSLSPTTPLPTASPTTGEPSTSTPTLAPITAAPVPATPTNLALTGLASMATECHNGFARKAIDGLPNTIMHSCSSAPGEWLLVDLGKDIINRIDTVVVKNRADCCGGRLRRFHVEVLDADKTVVWSDFHSGTVGNGVVKTWSVNGGAGALGRWVRVRFEETYRSFLHIAELEAWGYPVVVPANSPEIREIALYRPATQSSTYSTAYANKGVDGNFANAFHTKCGSHPWWEVDLGVDSFIQDVEITNRVQCCGGRLRDAYVELHDSDRNLVEKRLIKGAVGNGQKVVKVFNDDTSIGRYIRVSMSRNDCLHFAEMEVNGYHTMEMPTSSPTPTVVNLSLGKPATESTTYNNAGSGGLAAVDGDDETFTHTKCWTGINQWWEVDLGTNPLTIVRIEVVNRLNCCGGRLHDYTISFLNENEALVDSIFASGQNGNRKTVTVDSVNARFVKIQLGDQDCLSLGEVRVLGWYN